MSAFLTDGVVLSQAATQIRQAVRQMPIPHGYQVTITGEERERAESFGGLQFALLLSVVLVYMVMASLFESLLHPFTVMLTVPLAGIGVVIAFWSLGEAFGVMAFIGAIMLGGIAVNDAIILVDHINQLRRETDDVRQAVLQAAQGSAASDPDDQRHDHSGAVAPWRWAWAKARASGPRWRWPLSAVWSRPH